MAIQCAKSIKRWMIEMNKKIFDAGIGFLIGTILYQTTKFLLIHILDYYALIGFLIISSAIIVYGFASNGVL